MKTLDTVRARNDSYENLGLCSAATEWYGVEPVQLPSARNKTTHQSVGLIVTSPHHGESTSAKFIYKRSPLSTAESVRVGADIEDVGFPGATTATLAEWPRLWKHPEANLALQVISTLISGVGRSSLAKSECWHSIYQWVSGDPQAAKNRFQNLTEQWIQETLTYSDTVEIFLHPSYQAIIGMGPFALPFIFDELEKEPNHWFHALQAITRTDPVPNSDRGYMDRMRMHWLNWGKQNGFV